MITGTFVRGRGMSLRIDPRSAAVGGVLAIVLLGAVVVSLATGDEDIPFGDVLATLVGAGDAGTAFIVNELRLPRVLTAVFAGAALAVSGAVMQALTRNPLGSPDIIGFTHGAGTGALTVIIVLQGSMLEIATGALIGGMATAVVVYLLAMRRGVEGFRFILIGIGVSAMMLAVNSHLITSAEWQEGIAAQEWLVGTLNERGWPEAIAVSTVAVLLIPVAMACSRPLSLLEMGDLAATGLGVHAERARLVLIAISVTLVSVATAATGPIAFVALAAPQLARRIVRSPRPSVLPAALMGAVLLTVGDFLVQRVFQPTMLPVGVATGTLGGLYLIWLLSNEWRRSRGAV